MAEMEEEELTFEQTVFTAKRLNVLPTYPSG